jgi:3-phenylpropionate/trans-cinnamate dioxygenase ferredoxin component
MSDWVKVARLAEFPAGERRVIEVDGVSVAVFHLDDGFYAIEDVCTHDGGELASGELVCNDLVGNESAGCEITCPRHGARFNLKTGAVTAPPAYEAVAVLPLRLAGDWLEVRDNRWD